MSLRFAALAVAALSIASAGGAVAQAQGGYTSAQADRGLAAFKNSCSLCHGDDFKGGAGTPPLSGPDFMFGWKGRSAAELFAFVKTRMPPGGEGGLPDSDYADLVAAILKANGQPTGSAELPVDPAGQAAVKITAP